MNDARKTPLAAAAARVQQALADAGLDCVIIEHATPARTSAEAAATLSCSIGQIAKSLVFRAATAENPDELVLVIASGANRVDEAKVGALCNAAIAKADARAVRETTGYAIGGIPPLAHATALTAFVDRDLMRFDVVYAAGGTPNAMFPIRPADLVRVSGGRVADVALLST